MEKKKFRQGAEADIALSRLSKTKRIIPFLTNMGGVFWEVRSKQAGIRSKDIIDIKRSCPV
ncbi:hypothetical protein [Porphyromonas gingivalis]|uniref:hypothetical protein n=1 Tax=Porphyromonas gingivalis TaxID=837 RepID=UPI0015D06250|nr:hypothetical protein [Porphyromonas gingivalis]